MNVKSVPILNIPQNMILSILPYCILNRASWIKIQDKGHARCKNHRKRRHCRALILVIFTMLMFATRPFAQGEIDQDTPREDADILASIADEDILTALETDDDEKEKANRALAPKVNINGFVDFGWIYPSFLADEPENSDHHYAESGNAQNMVNKLEARTFPLNEVNFGFDISYTDYVTGKVNVVIYPISATNILGEYSAMHRDQDIPRDAGPDGKFGTEDDIIGEDTAPDPGDGKNQLIVGVKHAYLDLAYPGNFNAFLRIGQVPSLLGIEQEIFQAPDLPTVAPSAIGPFAYGYPHGIQLRGFLSALSDEDLEFGLGFTHDANNRMNAFPADVTRNLPFALANDNLVFAGRLAFSQGVRNRFTLGVSGQTGRKGQEASFNDGRFSSFHPFAKLRLDPSDNPNIGPFRIRAEYLIMDIENRIGSTPNQANKETEKYNVLFKPKVDSGIPTNQDGDARLKGFYVYLYVDLIKRLTLTLGHSRVDSEVIESIDPVLFEQKGSFFAWGFRRTQIAARYKLHDDVVIKAEFQRNKEDFGPSGKPELDNDIFTTSLVHSF